MNIVSALGSGCKVRVEASGSRDGTVRIWDVASGRWRATLVSRGDGWAVFTSDGRYKLGGNPAGSFWFLSGLCRFEPGELDPFVPSIRRPPPDAPLF